MKRSVLMKGERSKEGGKKRRKKSRMGKIGGGEGEGKKTGCPFRNKEKKKDKYFGCGERK